MGGEPRRTGELDEGTIVAYLSSRYIPLPYSTMIKNDDGFDPTDERG